MEKIYYLGLAESRGSGNILGDLERRMQQFGVQPEQVAKRAAMREASLKNSQEFIDMMRTRRVGTTALYQIAETSIMRTPWWGSKMVDTGRVRRTFDHVGDGWVINECSGEYDRRSTNYIILEDNTTVRCNPPVTERRRSIEPEAPYVLVQEDGLEACIMEFPFCDDRRADWLAHAAMRLTT
jgi:hypothetical protein